MKKLTSEEFRSNPMFLRNQFKTEGTFDIPIITNQKIDLSKISLIGYDQTKPDDKENKEGFVHFFLNYYKFEVIWNDPEPRLKKLIQYKGVLTPQFSTYYTMPASLQIYNTFHSRWCGICKLREQKLEQNGIIILRNCRKLIKTENLFHTVNMMLTTKFQDHSETQNV